MGRQEVKMEALNKNLFGGTAESAVISRQFKKEENYWLDKFSGNPAKSTLPGDYQRGSDTLPVPGSIKFEVSGEIFSRLMKLSSGSDPKLHMILTAMMTILLHKYTDNTDIILGTPIYRQDVEAEFINTVLPLRTPVETNMTVKELLLRVRDIVVEADAHQNYPIDMLLQKLEIPYAGGEFPLFDTALSVENIQDKKYLDHIQLNLVFSFLRTGRALQGELWHNAAIYTKNTAQRLAGHFTGLLADALDKLDGPIAEIDILTEAERHRLLEEFNDTGSPYDQEKNLLQGFSGQAEKKPNNAALRFAHPSREEEFVTYRQLEERSNRLARFLRKGGVKNESVVGIMMDRSIDQVIGLLGILKSGGAYLPIDPGLPPERITYMLRNSRAHTLLTDAASSSDIPFSDLQGLEDNTGVGIKVTGIRPHIKEFNELPTPDRSHLDLRNYKNKIGMASVTDCISLQTTRGCPYECLYCHKIWSKRHVNRSAENIFGEIEYYYKNGVTNFAVIDDCFNLDSRASRGLFQAIINNGLKIQLFFPNGLRGDIMTPDYIDLMVEAGARGINLSLETASPRLQKLLKKNLDLDKFKRVVEYIAGTHPNVILEMATMHGFPSETEEEAMMTLNFIKDIKWLHFPYIHILKIFPNTEMEAFALENGISKADIMASRDRAFHELPETLPFPKGFTRKYQSNFLNEYFLSKERLKQVLPVQMGILSEQALAQKYNAYLPVEINNIRDVIEFTGLDGVEIPEDFNRESQRPSIFDRPFEAREPGPDARRILFLGLSQHFSARQMLYRVVEQPLGQLYLLTYLKERFGDQIDGRIYKSGNDFDSFDRLKALIDEYKPEIIGIRTLTFFKEFFHETVSLIRQWGFSGLIFTGGPYASSDYDTILKDKNIDLAVLGEGEYTMGELLEEMLRKDFQLPGPEILDNIKGIAYVNDFPGVDNARRVVVMEHAAGKIAGEDNSPLETTVNGNSLAYVMYTSGSTGKPKGVMVEHRQVNNCIAWMQEKFRLTETDIIVQRTNLTFDPSVWEIFWPLSTGASVKLLTQQQSRDAEFLLRLMAQAPGVTMMYCPATLVTGMTYLLNSKPAFKNLSLSMPWLIIGAEPISMEVVKNFYAYYKGKIVNTYGPTECTINNTYYDLERNDKRSIVPIGKPIDNNKIYILSPQMKLLPVNAAGEIWIAGSSVARGYIDNKPLTGANFIDNPFGEGRMYKTGDIGRWLEDGNIEIMGRIDEQVKIRGYRIELGEIKDALTRHPNITNCVVAIGDMDKNREPGETVRTCKICGITSSYPGITINQEGICKICTDFPGYRKPLDDYFEDLDRLERTIRDANKERKSPYDCLVLYSGGRGAAYALYRLKDMGFNVLAVTYDHGFMGKAAMERIRMITSRLNVDHVVLTHQNTGKILAESIKSAHTVCRGCYLTSSSLAAQYAYKNDIKVVVGATLSRGQIIDGKLFMFLQQGVTGKKELEEETMKFQKSIAEIEKNHFDLIGIDVVRDGSIYDTVTFLDFYRYCDITNEEMINYLNDRDGYWKTRKNHAIYSTNCPIKPIGDYAHLMERGTHFYGSPTSWEKRLGHLDLKNVKKDLECQVTRNGYKNFLARIKYEAEKQIKKEDKYLCAYYVTKKSGENEEVTSTEIKTYLQRELPDYMVPNYFMPLAEIPLTPNGKVDRKALPLPDTGISKPRADYVAPQTGMEKLITGLWKSILHVDKIGINDNFFDLGGNSLNIIEVNSKLQEKTGRDIPIVTMFTYPTVGKLARNLEQDASSREEQNEKQEKKRKELLNEGKNMMKQGFKKLGG
jgi:amino acid adenylation domain-containing protein